MREREKENAAPPHSDLHNRLLRKCKERRQQRGHTRAREREAKADGSVSNRLRREGRNRSSRSRTQKRERELEASQGCFHQHHRAVHYHRARVLRSSEAHFTHTHLPLPSRVRACALLWPPMPFLHKSENNNTRSISLTPSCKHEPRERGKRRY